MIPGAGSGRIYYIQVLFYFSFNRGPKLAGKHTSNPGGGGHHMDFLEVLENLSYISKVNLSPFHVDFTA